MAKTDTKDLLKFLKAFPRETQEMVLWLRDFAWDVCPGTNEIIYDNYNALAIGWSVSEKLSHTICSIAAYRAGTNVHFGFYWGSQIHDPQKMMLGGGNQYRYFLVKDKETFPKAYITKLVHEAHANVLAKVKDAKELKQGLTIVKSISPDKREAAKAKTIKKAKKP
ncbi:MAG TPA: hypothetical protein VG738_10075 [Chitinophagaceae bacterium]|nr:hypothetical protein [Chitinophagaceae bacterium]